MRQARQRSSRPLRIDYVLNFTEEGGTGFFNDQIDIGVYLFYGCGGGGGGYWPSNFTLSEKEGERGETASLSSSGVVFYSIDSVDSRYVIGDGGDVNVELSGDDGGDTYIKDSTGADILRAEGGDGGTTFGNIPYSLRYATDSNFPYGMNVGKGGDGGRVSSLGNDAATPGLRRRYLREEIGMKFFIERDTKKQVARHVVQKWFEDHRGTTLADGYSLAALDGTPYTVAKAASPVDYDPRLETVAESWTTDAGGYQQKVLEVVDRPVDEAAECMYAWLTKTAEAAGAALKNGYPQWEIDGWHKQEEQARAALADNSAVTPLLDSLASSRGVDRLWLAQKIVDKVAAYEAAYGALCGKRQALEDDIKAIHEDEDLSDSEKIAALRQISW